MIANSFRCPGNSGKTVPACVCRERECKRGEQRKRERGSGRKNDAHKLGEKLIPSVLLHRDAADTGECSAVFSASVSQVSTESVSLTNSNQSPDSPLLALCHCSLILSLSLRFPFQCEFRWKAAKTIRQHQASSQGQTHHTQPEVGVIAGRDRWMDG